MSFLIYPNCFLEPFVSPMVGGFVKRQKLCSTLNLRAWWLYFCSTRTSMTRKSRFTGFRSNEKEFQTGRAPWNETKGKRKSSAIIFRSTVSSFERQQYFNVYIGAIQVEFKQSVALYLRYCSRSKAEWRVIFDESDISEKHVLLIET